MRLSYFLFRILLASLPSFIYAFFFYIYAADWRGDETIVGIVRHGILVSGLVPLSAWLIVIFFAKSEILFKATSLAILQTLFHVPVFAFSAHSDGWPYWTIQLVEFLLIIPLIIMVFYKKSG